MKEMEEMSRRGGSQGVVVFSLSTPCRWTQIDGAGIGQGLVRAEFGGTSHIT